MSKQKEPKPHYVGHRKRHKDKFIKNPPNVFSDYELLELLLFQSIPRRDVKSLSKELIQKFGNFNNLLSANMEKLSEVCGTNENIFLHLRIIKEILNRVLSSKIVQQHVISSWSALLEYLKFNMGNLQIEQFRVLFLNKKNILITEEVMSTGTIDQAPAYPREIVKRALANGAGAIILVHNHPSGNTNPSNSDIDLTTQIVNACKTVNVNVHDHIIIAGGNYYSFKTNMLL